MFNLGCGGVLLTAPQMKFIGIFTSPSLSQPLHHVMCDKWLRSPEQIILLPEMFHFFCHLHKLKYRDTIIEMAPSHLPALKTEEEIALVTFYLSLAYVHRVRCDLRPTSPNPSSQGAGWSVWIVAMSVNLFSLTSQVHKRLLSSTYSMPRKLTLVFVLVPHQQEPALADL